MKNSLESELEKVNAETKILFELIQVEKEITKSITHYGEVSKSLMNKEKRLFKQLEQNFNIDSKKLYSLLEMFG